MSNNSTIKCPNCHHEFPIGNALAKEIEDDIRSKYTSYLNDARKKMDAEKAQLAKDAEQLKLQSENQERILADKMRLAKIQLEEEATKKAASELKLQMDVLNKELSEKSEKLKESQAKELELLQKEKQIREREETMKLELEKQLL